MSFDQFLVFLPVGDLERAREFYSAVVGLELVRDQGSCLIFRVASGGFLGVCDHLAGGSGDVITTLVAEDVDAVCKRLSAAGVDVDGPRRNDRFGIYHAFFSDPDGNRLEVQRFDDAL